MTDMQHSDRIHAIAAAAAKVVPKVPITMASLKEERRRERRIQAAVDAFTPYVLRSLESGESGWLDFRNMDPVKEAVRKLFYGLKGEKNEVAQKIKRLTKQETVVAVARSVQSCLTQPTIVARLSAAARERKKVLASKTFDHWGENADRELRPKRLRRFQPLPPPSLTARVPRRAR